MHKRLERFFHSPLILRLRLYGVLLMPCLCYALFLLRPSELLLAAAPLLSILALGLHPRVLMLMGTGDVSRSIESREALITLAQTHLDMTYGTEKSTACFVVELDDFADFKKDVSNMVAVGVLESMKARLNSVLREEDRLCFLGDARAAVVLGPKQHLNLSSMIELSTRVKTRLSETYGSHGVKFHSRCSIGFCLPSSIQTRLGSDVLEGAEIALREAQLRGAGSIRAFSPQMEPHILNPDRAREELIQALECDQILPWYQPQVCASTGRLVGMEALARWHHPEQGLIAPAQFMYMAGELRLMDRLTERIVRHALGALKAWDQAGHNVPTVGVNFSTQELSNPNLTERLQWELDRSDLPAGRLTVEILEDVISTSPDDMILRNIEALRALGCPIDLDDFGTGHASFANLRRYGVNRIKIDRSYVARCDVDEDQQRLLDGIFAMAERIGVDTLAEGVETQAEQEILTQMGCGQLQGYLISHPLSFEDSFGWLSAHSAQERPATLPRAG